VGCPSGVAETVRPSRASGSVSQIGSQRVGVVDWIRGGVAIGFLAGAEQVCEGVELGAGPSLLVVDRSDSPFLEQGQDEDDQSPADPGRDQRRRVMEKFIGEAGASVAKKRTQDPGQHHTGQPTGQKIPPAAQQASHLPGTGPSAPALPQAPAADLNRTGLCCLEARMSAGTIDRVCSAASCTSSTLTGSAFTPNRAPPSSSRSCRAPARSKASRVPIGSSSNVASSSSSVWPENRASVRTLPGRSAVRAPWSSCRVRRFPERFVACPKTSRNATWLISSNSRTGGLDRVCVGPCSEDRVVRSDCPTFGAGCLARPDE